MSLKQIRRKCRHCRTFFIPDYRHRSTQFYCSCSECRAACKVAQQRGWLRKGKNRDYFRGEGEVERVRKWRLSHPGYWKKKTPLSQGTQVAVTKAINLEHESCNVPPSTPVALQDFWVPQQPGFIGLIAMITGSTLQDEIATTARNVIIHGQNILGLVPPGLSPTKTVIMNQNDHQTNPPTGPAAADSHQL
jgi:hypothetical protein